MVGAPGLFDLPSWRRGGEATFKIDQGQLQRGVTEASAAERGAARLALAEFYFAHGLLDEAKDALAPAAMALLNKHSIAALLVVDEDRRPIGIIHFHDLLRVGVV